MSRYQTNAVIFCYFQLMQMSKRPGRLSSGYGAGHLRLLRHSWSLREAGRRTLLELEYNRATARETQRGSLRPKLRVPSTN